ncbi:hypothetical protein ACHAXN_010261 [Cyclotella atomus]
MAMPRSTMDTSMNQITREEIRLTIQLQIMAIYRRTFILEELNRMVEQSRGVGLDNAESDSGTSNWRLLYDRDNLVCLINRKLRLHRSVIRRHAYLIDDVLYSHATTMEEYCCLEDLEDRVNMVLNGSSLVAQWIIMAFG